MKTVFTYLFHTGKILCSALYCIRDIVFIFLSFYTPPTVHTLSTPTHIVYTVCVSFYAYSSVFVSYSFITFYSHYTVDIGTVKYFFTIPPANVYITRSSF